MKNFKKWLAAQPEAVQELTESIQKAIFEGSRKLLEALDKERRNRRIMESAIKESSIDPESLISIRESADLGTWVEAHSHMRLTVMLDELYANGYINRQERLAFSGAVGVALQAFRDHMMEHAPEVFDRDRWDSAPPRVLGAGDLEESEFQNDIVPLDIQEGAIDQNGEAIIKLIDSGWGASGFYPAGVLERDGPKVFTKGIKMYWNHPTLTEDVERPERDLNDLAAELVEDSIYKEKGPKGPGLYARAKVFNKYSAPVEELAPHIGVSIRAMGTASHGVAEGKEGPIIQQLLAAKSADFVTQAGRGGEIVQMFEAARNGTYKKVGKPREAEIRESGREARNNSVAGDTNIMDPKIKKLLESKDEKLDLSAAVEYIESMEAELKESGEKVARFEEAKILVEANKIAAAELAKDSVLPDPTKARILESLSKNVPTKDGSLDKETLEKNIIEAVKAEKQYLIEMGAGDVIDLGESEPTGGELEGEEDEKKLGESLSGIFNLNEEALKVAVKGR